MSPPLRPDLLEPIWAYRQGAVATSIAAMAHVRALFRVPVAVAPAELVVDAQKPE